MLKLANGSTFKEISNEQIRKLIVTYPDKIEQKKIVSLFSKIDQRIDVQRKTIEDLKKLRESLCNAFYRSCKRKKIASLYSDGVLVQVKQGNLRKFSGPKIYISTSSVDEDTVIGDEGLITYENRPSRASMEPLLGSVWFAKMKSTNKVVYADEYLCNKVVLSTGFYGVLPQSPILGKWLKYFFLTKGFNEEKDGLSEGGTMSGIKDSAVLEITIPLNEDEGITSYEVLALDTISEKLNLTSEATERLSSLKKLLLVSLF